MATQPIDPIKNIGDDATATFESDPKFTEPTPGSEGSSDNVEEQRVLAARDSDDLEDSDEEDAVDEEEEDDVDEDEEFDNEDEEDEEELDDEEDEDDEEYEDDGDEVAAAPYRADGLLGYEDEADDVEDGRSEEEGNAQRRRAESKLKNDPGNLRGTDQDLDDDAGDVAPGVSEDEITDDDLDTDRIAAKTHFAAQVLAAQEPVRIH